MTGAINHPMAGPVGLAGAFLLAAFAPRPVTAVVAVLVIGAALVGLVMRVVQPRMKPGLVAPDHGWAAAGEGPPGMGISGTHRDTE